MQYFGIANVQFKNIRELYHGFCSCKFISYNFSNIQLSTTSFCALWFIAEYWRDSPDFGRMQRYCTYIQVVKRTKRVGLSTGGFICGSLQCGVVVGSGGSRG